MKVEKFIALHDLEDLVEKSITELERRFPNCVIKQEVVTDSEGHDQLCIMTQVPSGDRMGRLVGFFDEWLVNQDESTEYIVFDVGSL